MSKPIQPVSRTILVRYGTIPEVARFQTPSPEPFSRGQRVVMRTHRGIQIGEVLEEIRTAIDSTHESVIGKFDKFGDVDPILLVE